MARALRPLTLFIIGLVSYLVGVWTRGFLAGAFFIVAVLGILLAIARAFHERRHPPRHSLRPRFTHTPGWRAFKLLYCLAVPAITIWSVYAYDAAQPNPY
jgi:hypothetical protein